MVICGAMTMTDHTLSNQPSNTQSAASEPDPLQSKAKAAKLITRLIGLLAAQHQETARRVIEAYGL